MELIWIDKEQNDKNYIAAYINAGNVTIKADDVVDNSLNYYVGQFNQNN